MLNQLWINKGIKKKWRKSKETLRKRESLKGKPQHFWEAEVTSECFRHSSEVWITSDLGQSTKKYNHRMSSVGSTLGQEIKKTKGGEMTCSDQRFWWQLSIPLKGYWPLCGDLKIIRKMIWNPGEQKIQQGEDICCLGCGSVGH